MKHTAVIEAHSEEVLGRIRERAEFDQLITWARKWAGDGGVEMSDEHLRGAFTALAYVVERSPLYGMPVMLYHLVGEAGAVMLGLNRQRDLTPAEEAEMIRLLESVAGGTMPPEDPIDQYKDAVTEQLVHLARTALAQDDLELADSYLSAISRRVAMILQGVRRDVQP